MCNCRTLSSLQTEIPQPLSSHSPLPLAPAPGPTDLLAISVDLHIPDITQKGDHTIRGLSCLALSLAVTFSRFIPVVACASPSLLFIVNDLLSCHLEKEVPLLLSETHATFLDSSGTLGHPLSSPRPLGPRPFPGSSYVCLQLSILSLSPPVTVKLLEHVVRVDFSHFPPQPLCFPAFLPGLPTPDEHPSLEFK